MIEVFPTGPLFTNSYVVSNDNNECIIIDCGLSYKKISEYINNKYKVKAILLTHGHFDHIDGLKYFKGCDVYIYKEERDFLSNNRINLYEAYGTFKDFSESEFNIHTLYNHEIIDIIGFKLEVIHTPGHTKGSVVYLMDDVLFSGDTLFMNSMGRVDFPTGSYSDMLESLGLLAKMDENLVVYPGHGDKTTIKNEKKYNPYMSHM